MSPHPSQQDCDQVIQQHALWASGAGLIPIPLVDLAAVTAVQVDMIRALGRLFGQEPSASAARSLVLAVAGTAAARVGASGLKLIPGLGSLAGSVGLAAASGAATWSIGQVAVGQFKAGGTLDDVDVEAAREEFQAGLEQGEHEVERARDDDGDAYTRLERLAELRDKGVISAEDFEQRKQRLLDQIA